MVMHGLARKLPNVGWTHRLSDFFLDTSEAIIEEETLDEV
jgi:hypothetical protein